MGRIIAQDVIPITKFLSPANLDTIEANKTFTVKLNVANLVVCEHIHPSPYHYLLTHDFMNRLAASQTPQRTTSYAIQNYSPFFNPNASVYHRPPPPKLTPKAT